MAIPFFVDQNGVPLVEDNLPKPSTIEDVDDYHWDMNQLTKLAQEQAKKQSTNVKE